MTAKETDKERGEKEQKERSDFMRHREKEQSEVRSIETGPLRMALLEVQLTGRDK